LTGQVTQRKAANGVRAEAVPGTSVIGAVTDDIARWAAGRGLAPLALSGFSLGFAAIAAVWLTGITVHAQAIALVALVASSLTCCAARVYAGRTFRESRPRANAAHVTSAASVVTMASTPTTDWAQGACALLAEFAVYAGIAGGVSANASAATGLTGPAGTPLRDTALATIGGAGPEGVWRLAIAAAILLAVREMANLCLAAAKARTVMVGGQDAARRILVPAQPSGIRLVLLCLVVIIAGARPAFLLALAIGAIALLLRFRVAGPNSGIIGYRGDGPLSVWIGGFVDGRLPPAPPLLVGLLVTGVLTAFGVGNLPGFLVFTPAEAMLLAALGCWHRHDGQRDWLVPALLHAGEYVFLAALGFAGKVPPPVTFALVTAVALRHFDLAYRARNQVSPGWFIRPGAAITRSPRLPGADWRALGWEGRMIIAAFAAAVGVLPYAYPVFAVYLWALLAREAVTGWSAGHPAAGETGQAIQPGSIAMLWIAPCLPDRPGSHRPPCRGAGSLGYSPYRRSTRSWSRSSARTTCTRPGGRSRPAGMAWRRSPRWSREST
jgi:hypothetical protein